MLIAVTGANGFVGRHITALLAGRAEHERVALLGGHCNVNSQPGEGTQVIAEVPLARPVGTGGKDGA